MSIERKDLACQIVLFITVSIIVLTHITNIVVEFLVLTLLFVCTTKNFLSLSTSLKNERENYINILSHDLRVSVIAQIRGLELLKQNFQDNFLQKELIEDIDESCKYSLDMINMLIGSYKFREGQNILNLEILNINDLLKETLGKIQEKIKKQRIKIYHKGTENTFVETDRYYMQKLFSILIPTVLNFSDKHSPLHLILENNDLMFKFSIVYRGKFLTEEEKNRMFLISPKFSTVGHGIKMYLCKKIVDFHKGKFYLNSYKNKLNMFTFVIPKKFNKNHLKTSILNNSPRKYA